MGVLEADPRTAISTAPSPAIVVPSEGASVDAAYATFEWEPVPGADNYSFQASEDADFTEVIVDASVGDATSLTLFEAFPPDGRERYARVEALDGVFRVSMSDVRAFRPVTDTELESERMPKKPAVRRAPVTRMKQATEAAPAGIESEETSMDAEEPWRTGTTSIGLVWGVIVLMVAMIAVFAAVLFI